MSRIYWLSVFAAVGLAIATHAQAVGHDARGNASTAQGEAKPQADAKPSVPVAVQNNIQRIARALETANNKQPSAKEDQRAERDVQAQQNMAYWARWMFFVGLGEMVLTAAGVFLVWRTLKATWATKNESTRAADAAELSVTVAEKYNRQAMRAYVGISKRTVRGEGGKLVCVVTCKNFGQTPAYKLRTAAGAIIDGPQPKFPELELSNARTTLDPSAELNFTRRVTPTEFQDATLEAKDDAVWSFGRVEYVDAFDEPRFADFRYFLSRELYSEIKGGVEVRLSLAPSGNDSN